jgi:S-(hydroxymethyl)mycothiol dehydrogenase
MFKEFAVRQTVQGVDFPALIDLYLRGRLPFDKFVTERIALDQVEKAFDMMHASEVQRSVVVL